MFLDIAAKLDVQIGYEEEKGNKQLWSSLNINFYAWKCLEEVFGEYSGKCCHILGLKRGLLVDDMDETEFRKKKKDQSREFGSIRAVKISLDMMTEKEPGKRVRNDTMS